VLQWGGAGGMALRSPARKTALRFAHRSALNPLAYTDRQPDYSKQSLILFLELFVDYLTIICTVSKW
jgi:hypothetical protein